MTRTVPAAVITLAIVSSGGCGGGAAPAPEAAKQKVLERGEYLVGILGCDDCHTPKKMTPEGPAPDMDRRFIGYVDDPNMPAPPQLPPGPWGVTATMDLTAWSGPWGISYGINITPDEDTGIGIWTEEMFVKMIRTGRHMGQSPPFSPPCPVRSTPA